MKIGPTNNLEKTPELMQQNQREQVQKEVPKEQKDTLDISQAGRDKLKELADSSLQKVGNDDKVIDQISPKAAKIRNKVEAGYYDLANVQEQIVNKITDSIFADINENDRTE